MSDIEQKMALDASQALSTLEALDAGFKNFASTLSSMGGSFGTFNSSSRGVEKTLRGIASASNSAAAAMAKLSTLKAPAASAPAAAPVTNTQSLNAQLAAVTANYHNAGAAAGAMGNQSSTAIAGATRSAGGFAISLETITRVIATQAIVRGLTAIRTATEESFQGFIKFNQAAAEIQTILDQPLEQIRDDVRALSDEFNAPILDVAKGKYEAISNGFVTAADSSKVLTAALKFSKVGIATVTESVDLISTSLNAYGNTADHAETISAKLFKTIELGRVVGTELANSFGRVAPVAKEIGASEDEILAAFSSITIGGVKASEAATQIRATLTALLKPSDAATDAFHKLGVESGEQLIQAKGLQGALQSLIGTTDGSASAIAKLFPNVRALNGVLRETGTGVDIYSQHLSAIQKAGADLLNKKYKIRVESNAEKVATDLNKLGNALRTEVGEQLVTAAHYALQATGGVETLTAAGEILLPVLASGAVALGVYSAAMAAVSAKNSLIRSSNAATSKSFKALGATVGTVAAIFSAIEIGRGLGNYLQKQIDLTKDATAKAAKAFAEGQQRAAAANAQREHKETDDLFRSGSDIAATIKAAYNSSLDDASAANARFVSSTQTSMDAVIKSHQDAADKAKSAWEKAESDIARSMLNTRDQKANLSDVRFDFSGKNLSPVQQSSRDRERALELSKQGASKLAHGDREGGEAILQRADAYARAAVSAADASKSSVAQVQSEQVIETLIERRIKAEKSYQLVRATDAKAAAKAADAELTKATKLQGISDKFAKNGSLFGDDGKPLGGKDAKAHLDASRQALKDFSKESGLSIDQLKIDPKALENVAIVIQGDLSTRKFVIKNLIVDPSKLNGPKTLGDLLDEGGKQRDAKHTADTNAINSKQKLAGIRAEETAARTRADLLLNAKPGLLERGITAAKAAASPTSFAEIDKQEAQYANLKAQVLALTRQKSPIQAQQVLAVNSQAQTLSGNAYMGLDTRMDTLSSVIQGLTSAILSGTQKASAPPEEAEDHALGGLIRGYAKGGIVLGNQMPGPGYMAGGGFVPRGTDTVPAMLSPGEMVIPARQTKQFYSQLQSIRAGIQPDYKAGGGDVHYHDYTVNNTIHAPDAKASAREMMNSIRREQRKGTR